MSLGEPGTHQCQVHAEPTHREGDTDRVLVAVAAVPGLDDTSQNDPDCAGVLGVTGYRAQVPQCHCQLNRSPVGLGQDRRSQSRSMTALGTPASVSRSPTLSATEVMPAPTVPVISKALHESLGGMGTHGRYEF